MIYTISILQLHHAASDSGGTPLPLFWEFGILRSHSKGELVLAGRFRRRDADGGGRDDRAPLRITNDWGCNQQSFPSVWLFKYECEI